MTEQFKDIFYQQGYRYYTLPEKNMGVFYKYYQEGFHLVMVLEDGQSILPVDKLRIVQEQVMDIFYHPKGRLLDFPDGYPVYHVEMLTLLLTGQTEWAHHICTVYKNVWVYEQKAHQLIIYENQPGDFWGLRGCLEHYNESFVTNNKKIFKNWKTFKKELSKFPFITSLLVLINIVVYLILSIGGATENALYMAENGAMYPDFITYNHELWRFFTAMFLHFGITHLTNNMIILACMGSRLEKVAGHWKMTVIYLAAGIGGGILSYIIMLYTGDYAVSAGASGAIFGVIGGLLWVVIRHKGNIEGMTPQGMAILLILSLYFGFTTAGVDNWCHIGGLIFGFITAVILYRGKGQKY